MTIERTNISTHLIPVEVLNELFTFDSETGILKYKIARNNSTVVGTEAGGLNPNGYRIVKVFKKNFKVHRVGWAMTYGEWPKGQLDHINGIRDDNRIVNLREVCRVSNANNRNKHRNGVPSGVVFHKPSKMWVVRAPGNVYIGYCKTLEGAIELAKPYWEERNV